MLKTSSSLLLSLPSQKHKQWGLITAIDLFEVLPVCLTFVLNSWESVAALAPDVWETSYNMFQKVPVWLHVWGKNGVRFVFATTVLSSWEHPLKEEGRFWNEINRSVNLLVNISLDVSFYCKCWSNIAESRNLFSSLWLEELSVPNTL